MTDPSWIYKYWQDENDDYLGNRSRQYAGPASEFMERGSAMPLDTPERGELPGLSDWDKGADIGQKAGSVLGLGSLGAGLGGGVGTVLGALGPIGAGIGVVSTIAGMIGSKKAQDEAEEQRRKEEALRRAAWMSQNRERAVGRWGY